MNYYVYILESQINHAKHYTGFTENIDDRIQAHNNGLIPDTSAYRPWDLKSFVAFNDKQRALDFEQYLSSDSALYSYDNVCHGSY